MAPKRRVAAPGRPFIESLIPCPLGWFWLRTGPAGLLAAGFGPPPPPPASPAPAPAGLETALRLHLDVLRRVQSYFGGGIERFDDLPLAPRGSEFQRSVWDALRAIPRGSVRSYGELAALLGRPGGSRAVGQACGANPWPVIVPCHRVVAAGGRLGGFTSGLDRKRWLLRLERAALAPAQPEIPGLELGALAPVD